MNIKAGDKVRVKEGWIDSDLILTVSRVISAKCQSGYVIEVKPPDPCPLCGACRMIYSVGRDSDWFEKVEEKP